LQNATRPPANSRGRAPAGAVREERVGGMGKEGVMCPCSFHENLHLPWYTAQ